MPKISEYPAGTTPTGTESIPAVQGGVTVKLTAQQIADRAGGTSPVAPNRGGTGVANNAASTITISGSFGTTFTVTGTTALTLPTTGTLATLAGSETFTNKVLTAPDINGGTADSLTSLSVRSTGAAFDLALANTEVLTAGRTLTIKVNDAARTIDMAGNLVMAGGVNFAGSLTTSGSFASTFTMTGTTTVTFPTTGTLATTTDLALKANLAGGNAFTGAQTFDISGTTVNRGFETFTSDSGTTNASYAAICYGGAGTGFGGGQFHGGAVMGTRAAPTAAIADQMISGFGGIVYTGAAWTSSSPASCHYILLENATPTAHGACINWYSTAIGSAAAARVNSLSLTQDGTVHAKDNSAGFSATSTLQTKPSSDVILLASGANSSIGAAGYGQQGGLHCFRASGTVASPTATAAAATLGFFGARGYTTNAGAAWGTSSTGLFRWVSAEAGAFTTTAQGTYGLLGTTPIGSATRSDWLYFNEDASLGIGTATKTGAGTINAANGVYEGGSLLKSLVVRYDTAQSLTATQKKQARANIGTDDKNFIINSSGTFYQSGVGTQTDGTYDFDQWLTLTETAAVTVSQQADQEDGTPFVMRSSQAQAVAQRMGRIQWIEKLFCRELRGQTVALSARVRMSAATTLRYAIIEWTGIADTITKDVVLDWTNTTFTAGQFFTTTSTTIVGTGSIALTANTFTDITTLTGTVSSSMNNLAVFFWTSTAQAQNVTLDIAKVKLEKGAVASGFTETPFHQDLSDCNRYYFKTFDFGTTPAQNIGLNLGDYIWPAAVAGAATNRSPKILFPVRMRVAPTVTGYNPAAANGQARDQTASADCSATTFVVSDNGLRLGVTGAAGTAVGNALGVHFTASARL